VVAEGCGQGVSAVLLVGEQRHAQRAVVGGQRVGAGQARRLRVGVDPLRLDAGERHGTAGAERPAGAVDAASGAFGWKYEIE
jgi:hypothetical protein